MERRLRDITEVVYNSPEYAELAENTSGYRDLGYARRYSMDMKSDLDSNACT